jgi:hypothetical protein
LNFRFRISVAAGESFLRRFHSRVPFAGPLARADRLRDLSSV